MMKPTKEELLKRAKASIDENEPDGIRDQLNKEHIDDHNAFIDSKRAEWKEQPANDELHIQVIQQYISLLETELKSDNISEKNTSEIGFCLMHSLVEFQMDKKAAHTKEQIHKLVSDLHQRCGGKLKDIHTFSYHGFPGPAAGLSRYVSNGEIFSGQALAEKALQRANETIGAMREQFIKGKRKGGIEGGKTKRKDAQVRRQILKSLITEDLINRWRAQEVIRSFPRYFHAAVHGNMEPPPAQLKDYVHQEILKVSLDKLRDDLNVLGIKPRKRKP